MRPIVITNARPLGTDPVEIRIDDGTFTEIGTVARDGDPDIIDAGGAIALPGLVDMHAHLREPGREDAETVLTGTQAAAAGGFTAVLAMANTVPVTDTAEAAEHIADLGVRAGYADVIPIGAVSKQLAGNELAELGLMHRSRAAVSVFSDDGKCVSDAGLMRRALEYISSFDGVISQHAQDPELAGPAACCHEGETSGRLGLPGWPTVAETSIIARDAELARHTGSRVHIAHVTTAEGVDVVRWAKKRGIRITAEVTPHHLALNTDLLANYDPRYKVNPPLRPTEDAEALIAGVADGTIDVIATDHAPHARHDKEHAFVDAAFGMVGLETALAVVHQVLLEPGHIGWSDIARIMSSAPATISKVPGHGRPLAVGEPANVTIIDPDAPHVVDEAESRSLARNNPWHGRKLTSRTTHTMLRGKFTVRDGEITE